jgi:integrase
MLEAYMPAHKITKPYPYLYRDRDRQGAVRWLLRAPGRKAVTIKGQYGSSEFAAAYRAALEGTAPEQIATTARHGTIAALARTYLLSATFAALAPDTRRVRRSHVEKFAEEFGKQSVATLERRHVVAMMDAHKDTPGAARNFLSMLRALMARAIDDGIIDSDPTIGIKRPKLSAAGWRCWTDAEIAQYEEKHPIGSRARLTLALAVNTGQRLADLIKMGRQHVKDGKISVAQQKTEARLWIPIHPELKAIIDATPSDNLTLLVTELGKPYASANRLGKRISKWARDAGVSAPPHGLRKACCRRLAEAGCTPHEIMAISGHETLAMVQRYCEDVARAKLAERAMART